MSIYLKPGMYTMKMALVAYSRLGAVDPSQRNISAFAFAHDGFEQSTSEFLNRVMRPMKLTGVFPCLRIRQLC